MSLKTTDRDQAVQAILAGTTSLEQVASRFGVSVPTVEGWRDAAFVAGIESAFALPTPTPPAATPHDTASEERDSLTGALAQRAFAVHLKEAFATAHGGGRPISLALMNIDRFAKLNDECGHVAGDRMLIALVRLLHGALRPQDTLGRYAGDGFALLLPDTPLPEASVLCDVLRSSVAGHRFPDAVSLASDNVRLPVTVCMGIAAMPDASIANPKAWVQRADAMLYAAKTGGRNRTEPRPRP